ncbi:hypothetical protein A2797_01380 [candidate division WWE3 bacterium RIFCSPHIGHO2_01_FULL_48_15]|uniref:Peptidase M60 domain-containing protein n=1 Tax=candidate division WWE3 bacterium RIFCSPHIGHO2_01_FULL_48_15 TaxID=1802619 RepID=A0A1F4VFE4_UNCKA|nr:MAG: hypothetical protein A2797_01380 [candidate division WWE3 bacterium RIFCSPHIGHO2_01_FULL_48_15]
MFSQPKLWKILLAATVIVTIGGVAVIKTDLFRIETPPSTYPPQELYRCSEGSCVRDDANGTSTYFGCLNQCQVTPPQVSPSESPQESPYMALDLYPEHLAILTDAQSWIQKLDDAYLAYQELVGQTPFSGAKITIKEVDKTDPIEAEMLSGNPIQWASAYVPDKLQSINEHDDLSFGPIHELGHDFDYYFSSANYLIGSARAINPEHWANFKLTYVADTLAGKYPDATFYQSAVGYLKIGEFSHKYFVEKFAQPWIYAGRTDWENMENDVFTGLLYLLKEQIGWELFKETFRDYAKMTGDPPSDDLGKVQLFADTLANHTSFDIKTEFRRWGFQVN